MKRRRFEDILKDLPHEEPWLELKFQLSELDTDLGTLLDALTRGKSMLGVRERARELTGLLSDVYSQVDHDAEAHAQRAMELARGLLAFPPESVPAWATAGASRLDFEVPPDIQACTSLQAAQAQVALHLEETFSAVQRAHQSVLLAADMTGPRGVVLEQVLKEATLCHQLLQDPAWPHAQAACQWSELYWRLIDPEGAAAHDARAAKAHAEMEAELAALDAAKGSPRE